MIWRTATIAVIAVAVFIVAGLASDSAAADGALKYKLAMVALVEDPGARAEFEDGLAAKFRANDYDAIASHELVPSVSDLGSTDIVGRLAEAGVQGIVMLRPAAVGAGSSLESVKNEISRDIYADMRAFARETSPGTADDELVAVVHTAIYMVRDGRVELLSAGAVWLDEPVETRAEGIGKLQDLIVLNMNKARPAVREYLGLPPMEK
jgi:hypothetical protein